MTGKAKESVYQPTAHNSLNLRAPVHHGEMLYLPFLYQKTPTPLASPYPQLPGCVQLHWGKLLGKPAFQQQTNTFIREEGCLCCGWWVCPVEFFSLLNQTEPCSFLAGRWAYSSKYSGKFCFDKHTHSFSKSHSGKRLCCRQTNSLPAHELKTFSRATEWVQQLHWLMQYLKSTQLPLYGFHIRSVLLLTNPNAGRLFVRHWDWPGARAWQESWGIFLWALVSWPVEPSPIIVPRSCQIKQGESFSRCLVTKRWAREGPIWMGSGAPKSQLRPWLRRNPSPSQGSDSAPWNVQWPPETLPFRQMPGTQAICTLAWGPDLCMLYNHKSNSLEQGVSIFSKLISLWYSVPWTEPVLPRSSPEACFLQMLSIMV